jgi:hypothetical protein
MIQFFPNTIRLKIDPDANAFFIATGITDFTIKKAVNDLVVSLKANNLWNKLNVIYPFVGGTATTHKFNLKDPRDLDVAFRAEFFGTVTHNSLGVVGDGSTGYYKTFIVNNTHIEQNNHSFFVYCNNNVSGSFADFAFRQSGNNAGIFNNSRGALNTTVVRSMNVTTSSVSNINSIGFFGFSRLINTEYTTFTNGSIDLQLISTLVLPNIEVYGFARNVANSSIDSFSTRRQAFFSFGHGLTNTEMTDLNNLVVAFQTTLGRTGL